MSLIIIAAPTKLHCTTAKRPDVLKRIDPGHSKKSSTVITAHCYDSMGQRCSTADGATAGEEGAAKSGRRQSKKYKSKQSEVNSAKQSEAAEFSQSASPEGHEDTGASDWVAGSDRGGCVAMAYRTMPKPLRIPRSSISAGFREYSSSKFGGEGNAFLSAASAHAIGGDNVFHSVLCAGEGRDVSLVDYETGHMLFRWPTAHLRDINRVTSPSPVDGGMFFTASRDTTVRGWRLGSESPVAHFSGHSLNVTALDFHPSGGRVATGSRDNTVRLWDTNGECIASQDVKLNIVHFVKWIPTLNVVAQGGEDLTVRLWDTRADRDVLELGSTMANFDYHPICADLEMASEGGSENVLFTGHNGFNGAGAMITEWDIRSGGTQVRHYRGHGLTVRSVRKLRAGPNAGCLVSVGDDDTLRLWRGGPRYEGVLEKVEKPLATISIPEGRPTSIDEAPDGKLFVSLRSGAILVFNPPSEHRFGERYRYIGTPFLE